MKRKTLRIPDDGPCAGHPCDDCERCLAGDCCGCDVGEAGLPARSNRRMARRPRNHQPPHTNPPARTTPTQEPRMNRRCWRMRFLGRGYYGDGYGWWDRLRFRLTRDRGDF